MIELDFNKDNFRTLKILNTLGGKTRLKILKHLSDGRNWTITDLARKMKCGIPNLSQQVKLLEEAGFVIKVLSPMTGNNVKYIKLKYEGIKINFKKNDN